MIIKSGMTSVEKELINLGLNLVNFEEEKGSKEYSACRFSINNEKYIYRKSKITPKKVGQFVTFWKRNSLQKTEPFTSLEDFDYLLINLKTETKIGYYCFPNSILLEKGILHSSKHKGKMGFRIYAPWDNPKSKQAINTQQWQIIYFFSEKNLDNKIKNL